MTDLEITKLCAKAIGIEFHEGVGLWKDGRTMNYDPLNNDAQCFELQRRLGVSTSAQPKMWWVVDVWGHKSTGHDLNRAICECVAKMMEGKK